MMDEDATFYPAYAAAQLAEKEREIADLTKKRDRLGGMVAEQGIAAHNATLRAEAAEQRLQEAQAERIEQLEKYDIRPFDKLPKPHAEHIEHWLESNEKEPADVRWSLYPIGMVGRWIERGEEAEAENASMMADIDQAWHALGMDDYEGENALDYFITQLRERQREADLEQLRERMYCDEDAGRE